MHLRLSALPAVVALVLVACGGGSQSAASGTAPSASTAAPAAKTAGSAASAPPATIKIAHSSTGATMMPIEIARASGAYARNGLSVQAVQMPNGVTALVAGDVQASVTSTEDIISADLGGADLVIVGVMLPYIGQDLIARPEIKTMSDLKGRPIGVTKRATVGETVVRLAAKDGGLDPDKDLQLIELGSADKEVVALQAGSIFAASLSRPTSDMAVSQGNHVLYNLTDKKIPYPASDITVQRSWAQKNPQLVTAILRSMAEAVRTIETQPQFTSEAYSKWAKSDADASKLAVELATSYIPLEMTPTVDGIKAVLPNVAEQVPAAATADPSRFIDDSYVKQLTSQGYYSKLASSSPAPVPSASK
jgi:NitT/TauT family transport system substrate-binding protein